MPGVMVGELTLCRGARARLRVSLRDGGDLCEVRVYAEGGAGVFDVAGEGLVLAVHELPRVRELLRRAESAARVRAGKGGV
jgi:hypothetical protein